MPQGNDLEGQAHQRRSAPGQAHTAEAERHKEQVHAPDNYHEQWAPRFRQIQSQGPSKKDEQYDPDRDLTWVSRLRRNLREPAAEFLGVFIMICFGDGSVAQVNLSKQTYGEYQSISWCWGIGVMMGVYVAGGISGGHLNPAVTFANCLYRRFPWSKLLPFTIAQILGGFCGAALVYGNYQSAIDSFEGGDFRTHATATIFSTYPADFLTTVGQFFSEVVATAILIICLFAIGDERNNPAGDHGPIVILFIIFGIGAAFGWETGYALNLARDFGPRLLSFAIGYGGEVFTYGMNYSIIPCTAPFVGAIIGGAIYDILIFTGDSPFNRERFGVDDWRWKKTVLNPVDELSEALPDALMQTRNHNEEVSTGSSSISHHSQSRETDSEKTHAQYEDSRLGSSQTQQDKSHTYSHAENPHRDNVFRQ
ncbi:protein of unknown function [Taphrina deformans PYCC 5710]|uniref:Aquaglyceroporin n=1 Tax=Taphrina deformans (strain PYCC 5710 / ATCC 11124 / CBS 356.35 / IMI 108563 / JCM 9778 / NBRC 8474) TaxID=1097556 RepID=R4XFF4_TAPDE|nr:protein of unknown function [Taphrina deformans PYCC 5710]|eukprot:CCG84506.1 protein of unknown function [Taphrina deformans PYCC 5710]